MAILDVTHHVATCIEKKLLSIGVFIDLSKAFDSINHSILLAKLNHYGIRGIALKWSTSYLNNRYHFVEINNIKSNNLPMLGGVPQGSVLGPVLFNLFINDVVLSSKVAKFVLYADDTTILFHHSDIKKLISQSNHELTLIYKWFMANNLRINFVKTCFVLFGPKILTNMFKPLLSISDLSITRVESVKFLGVILTSNLSWYENSNSISQKVSKNIGIIYKIKHKLSKHALNILYYSIIYPLYNYCMSIWGNSPKSHLHLIQKTQNDFIRLLHGIKKFDSVRNLFRLDNILTIQQIYIYRIITLFYKIIIKNIFPFWTSILSYFLKNSQRGLRKNTQFSIPLCRTKVFKNSTIITGIIYWNMVPDNVKLIAHFAGFKKQISILLEKNYF